MKKILYFDYETNGFPRKPKVELGESGWTLPGQARAVQIGAILVVNRRVIAELNVLVKSGVEVPEQVFEIHGINKAMCDEYGLIPQLAHDAFRNLVMMADLCISHNYAFDYQIAEIENAYCGYNPLMGLPKSAGTYCTMEATTEILKLPKSRGSGYKWPKLIEAHEHFFGESFSGAHDAMADVRALRRVHEHLVDTGIHVL